MHRRVHVASCERAREPQRRSGTLRSALSATAATGIAVATQQLLHLLSLPTWLSGSRSWGNGAAPEVSGGKKAAKVNASTAGRPVRGEVGVGLIVGGRGELSRSSWPTARSPSTWRDKVSGVSEVSGVSGVSTLSDRNRFKLVCEAPTTTRAGELIGRRA